MADEDTPDMRDLIGMASTEPLHPDLASRLSDGSVTGMSMIQHPLVHTFYGGPAMHAHYNGLYDQKKAAIEQAAQERNWSKYIHMYERPYRLVALLRAAEAGLDEDPMAYWKLVGEVWRDSESINHDLDQWGEIWGAETPDRAACMEKKEQTALARLPEFIDIWRGIGHEAAADGLSWTTDIEQAKWFAKRFVGFGGRKALLVSGHVHKEHVLAYFLARNEHEIVVFPENVEGMTVTPLD
jgi:hypothetical protein